MIAQHPPPAAEIRGPPDSVTERCEWTGTQARSNRKPGRKETIEMRHHGFESDTEFRRDCNGPRSSA